MRFPTPSMAVSLTALLVALGGAAVSATGGNFILGTINSASNQSGIVSPVNGKMLLLNNTSTAANATALGLTVKPGHPPLIVNSDTKVPVLNVDELDGFDSSDLTTDARTFTDSDTTTSRTGPVAWRINGLALGQYAIALNAPVRPTTGSPAAINIVECALQERGSNKFWATQASPFTGDFFAGVSGADALEVTTANVNNLQVLCDVQTGSWRLFQPLRITFIPLTSRTLTTVVAGAPKAPIHSEPRSFQVH